MREIEASEDDGDDDDDAGIATEDSSNSGFRANAMRGLRADLRQEKASVRRAVAATVKAASVDKRDDR